MIRIVLADDHALVRQAIARALADIEGFQVVGQASTAEEALEVVARLGPGGVEAVQAVARGETYIFPSLMHKLVGDYLHRVQSGETEPDELKRLTPREQEVLRLIAEGRTTNEIANTLTLSPHTVRRHRDNIMQKLNLHSKAELIRFAVRKGLLDELE